MPEVSLHRTFTDSVMQLPQYIQKEAWNLVYQVKDNPEPNGIKMERVQNTAESHIYSAQIKDDYQVVMLKPEAEDTILFVYVDEEEKAYRWAESRRFEINTFTGTFQIYQHSTSETNKVEQSGLFSDYTSDQLQQLGVPSDVLSQVFSLGKVEELLALNEGIPEDAKAALHFLAHGDRYEEVLDKIMDYRKPSNTYTESFINTPEQIAVITSDQHMQKILSYTIEQWRLFLHPSQLELVEEDFSGPVRVLGGAGTGKTVVALHRACHLALYRLQPQEKLLITTYTTNLANILSDKMDEMVSESVRAQIEIKNIDRLAIEICEEMIGLRINKIVKDEDWSGIWGQMKSTFNIDNELIQLCKQEYKYVIDPEGVRELDHYLEVVRTGMKTRLTRLERRQVWAVIEKLRGWMSERGWYGYSDLIRHARLWVSEFPNLLRYRAAIVDEVQDFSQEALKFVRALVPLNQNDLFFVGDPQQRIYSNRAVMSRCGIDVRGSRSKRLRINYRTTEQIRQQAISILQDIEYDDLDGGINPQDDISLLSGAIPVVHNFKDKKSEFQFVVDEITSLLLEGYQSHEIAVFARTTKELSQFISHMEAADILVNQLTKHSHIKKQGVHCGTMHRAKGLEFRVVFLVSMTKANMPLQYALHRQESDQDRDLVLKQERSLFYVACTRARERLYISSTGNPSPFLKSIAEQS